MDLSNYKLIQQEARRIGWLSPEDKEDLVQDVYVKLLQGKDKPITKAYIRRFIKNMLVDKRRKEASRAQVVYNSDLASKLIDKGDV